MVSSATDPYLQVEKKYELTRKALEIIARYRFPVHIITKSDLVLRDLDLLKEIDEHAILPEDLQQSLGGGTIISLSFSTLDDAIGKLFEPGAPKPSVRLETLEKVLQQGFHAGVSLMPLLPFITDTGENLEYMFSLFQRIGAKYVMPATLTLFGHGKADSKTLVLNAIEKHYPHLSEKYHFWFDYSNEMPEYYTNAFYKKMKELSAKYGLRDRILGE